MEKIWILLAVLLMFGAAVVSVCIYGHHSPAENLSKNAEVAEYQTILANNDQVVFVVIVKKGDDLFVLNEGTKQLVFEYNRLKPADATPYKVCRDFLDEAKALAQKQK